MHRLLQRQLKKIFNTTEGFSDQWRQFLSVVSDAYEAADSDRDLLEHSMDLSSRELIERNQRLAEAEQKYRAIFEHATEGIFQIDASGRILSANPALAKILGYDSPEELKASVNNVADEVYLDPQRWEELTASMTGDSVASCESQAQRKDGARIWILETSRAVRGPDGRVSHYEGTVFDITNRKRAEAERSELQGRLIALSRRAGMADVATDVLHNVGNVLNSLNVSASVLESNLRTSKTSAVGKIAKVLKEHEQNLAGFLQHDERGRMLPEYLSRLAKCVDDEHEKLLREVRVLIQDVQHIGTVIDTQQTYAQTESLAESLDLRQVADEALRMEATALERHFVRVEHNYQDVPNVLAERHHVLQIIVNLMQNAKQAMDPCDRAQRVLKMEVAASEANDGKVLLRISDTGIGISKENLVRIFEHGFTTKKDGHGFGLHSCSLAAKAMGGEISVASDGHGRGACFTLALPVCVAPLPRESKNEQIAAAPA